MLVEHPRAHRRSSESWRKERRHTAGWLCVGGSALELQHLFVILFFSSMGEAGSSDKLAASCIAPKCGLSSVFFSCVLCLF